MEEIRFINACSRGELDKLKSLLEEYKIEELDSDLKNSTAIQLAFRNCHFDLISYLFNHEELSTKIEIPSHVLKQLTSFDEEVAKFLLMDERIKHKFNVFESQDTYSNFLDAVCRKGYKELIEYLVFAPESKDFWNKKSKSLVLLCAKTEPDLDTIKNVVNHISSNDYSKKEQLLIDLYLNDCLLESLKKSNMELAHYFVIDANITVIELNRDLIRSKYPEGEKIILARELNETLNRDLEKKPRMKI